MHAKIEKAGRERLDIASEAVLKCATHAQCLQRSCYSFTIKGACHKPKAKRQVSNDGTQNNGLVLVKTTLVVHLNCK